MKEIKPQEGIERTAPRNPTAAEITCRPYASRGDTRSADGLMRNFSNGGSYIETSRQFKPGTILIVRMLRYPPAAAEMADDLCPRSICLAEVRWQQELAAEAGPNYGMGLRYID